MALHFYADEWVDARLVAGLRRRGVDIITAGSESLFGASDAEHVDAAMAMAEPALKLVVDRGL